MKNDLVALCVTVDTFKQSIIINGNSPTYTICRRVYKSAADLTSNTRHKLIK